MVSLVARCSVSAITAIWALIHRSHVALNALITDLRALNGLELLC